MLYAEDKKMFFGDSVNYLLSKGLIEYLENTSHIDATYLSLIYPVSRCEKHDDKAHPVGRYLTKTDFCVQ